MKFLRVREIQELTTLSRTTIWKLEREGKFPRGFSPPALPAAKVWLESDVLRWMQAQMPNAQRDAQLQPSAVRPTAA